MLVFHWVPSPGAHLDEAGPSRVMPELLPGARPICLSTRPCPVGQAGRARPWWGIAVTVGQASMGEPQGYSKSGVALYWGWLSASLLYRAL